MQGDTELLYHTRTWKKKRLSILERDNFECQRCNGNFRVGPEIKKIKLTKATTIHHIVELNDDVSRMLDDENLISLCHECHDLIHGRTTKNFNKPKKKTNKEMW